jgi:exonuclease VII large subunit
MEHIDQLKEDARAGRIDSDRLVDLIAGLSRQVQAANQQLQAANQQLEAANQQLEAANQRIAELEKQLGGAATAKVAEPFSMRAEEQRQEKRGRKNKRSGKNKKRRGRLKSADKVKQAERTEPVFPEGVERRDCELSHVRPVWRLENGRAVLVAY